MWNGILITGAGQKFVVIRTLPSALRANDIGLTAVSDGPTPFLSVFYCPGEAYRIGWGRASVLYMWNEKQKFCVNCKCDFYFISEYINVYRIL